MRNQSLAVILAAAFATNASAQAPVELTDREYSRACQSTDPFKGVWHRGKFTDAPVGKKDSIILSEGKFDIKNPASSLTEPGKQVLSIQQVDMNVENARAMLAEFCKNKKVPTQSAIEGLKTAVKKAEADLDPNAPAAIF